MVAPPFTGRRARRLTFGLALASAAAAAIAQYPGGAVVQSLPQADDPAERLAGALRTLAVSPRNLPALLEAGRNALTLGDPNAAVGFFGRATEIAPRDGRVKAGLGAALVALEKPRDALRYFQEASALGVADVDLAVDRGLAYDLVGDTARAQRDYQTVLAAHPDDDATRRRLALSEGIAGNRAAAIATLDPLIRKRDIAAWRAQTFVLAMTGDAKGANDITRVMLPQQAAMLQPFLVRLAALSPADKARAVHFGEMPAGGRSYEQSQLATTGPAPTYAPAPAPTAAAVRSDLAPTPARPAPAPIPQVAVATAAPVKPAAAAPRSPVPATQVAAATPAPTAHSNEVIVDGVRMKREMRSAQDIFGLGMPPYTYVPVSGATVPVTQVATAPRPAPAAVSAPAPIAAPTVAPVASAAIPSPATTSPAAPPLSSPAAAPLPLATAQTQTGATALAMPLGSSALSGHYDLPHDATVRRPVARSVQPSARTPAPIAVATRTVAVPEAGTAIVTTPRTKAVARPAPVEIADADQPAPKPVASRHRATTPDEPALVAVEETGKHRPAKGKSSPAAEADEATDKTRAKPRVNTGADDDAKSSRGKHGSRAGQHDRTDDDAPAAKGKSKTRSTTHDDTTDEPKAGKDKSKTTDTSGPTKIYVQVAGGANRADMDKAWSGVKGKAPELMKGHTPSTTPIHATNRLLVGPFKDDGEAQAFVNKMAAKGLSGFTVRTAKGQKVEKIDDGR